MSKQKHKRSPEIPAVGNALEVPNYVLPMTDLEYRQTVEQTEQAELDCAEDCRPEPSDCEQ